MEIFFTHPSRDGECDQCHNRRTNCIVDLCIRALLVSYISRKCLTLVMLITLTAAVIVIYTCSYSRIW